MHHLANEVTLQGRVGPPTVRLARGQPFFASVELEFSVLPRTTVTVAALGMDAATIAACRPGDLLRAEGEIALDPESGEFFVMAASATRLVVQGTALVPLRASLADFDRLEAVLASPA